MQPIFKNLRAIQKYVFFAVCLLAIMIVISPKAYALTGDEYDSNLATVGWITQPSVSGVWYKDRFEYTVQSTVSGGYATTVSGGRDIYYDGTIVVYANGEEAGRDTYRCSVADKSPAGTVGSDSGTISYDLSSYVNSWSSSNPSCSGYVSHNSSTAYLSASASGGSKTGTVSLVAVNILDDWFGMNNDAMPQHTEIQRTGAATLTVSSTDPISYYYYTYDYNSGTYALASGNRGYGSSFSDRVGFSYAGMYCHVTFYTESGKSTSCTMQVPYTATLNYNANGGWGAPSGTTTVWSGDSVYISSVVPTRTNYTFLGWSTSNAYTELAYNASAPSGTLTAGSSYYLTRNTTLYAVWRQIKVPYTLKLTINGKTVTNDFAYVTGYVNGSETVTNDRGFSALELPGYNVRARVKSSDSSVYILNDNPALDTDYEFDTGTKTINVATTDTVACGTIHTITYDANGGNYGKDIAGNDNAGPENQKKKSAV